MSYPKPLSEKSLRCVYGECGLSDQKVDQQHAQQLASVVHPRLDAERAVNVNADLKL